MKQNRKSERGSTMVECSLVLIVFLMMLIGIFDFGQALYLHTGITERVREALRWGVVNSYDQTAIQNYVLYGQTTQPQGASTFFSLTPSMVTVERDDAGTSDDRIVIKVSNYQYQFLSPYIAGTKTGQTIVEALPYEGQ